jgi:hypothetical protein
MQAQLQLFGREKKCCTPSVIQKSKKKEKKIDRFHLTNKKNSAGKECLEAWQKLTIRVGVCPLASRCLQRLPSETSFLRSERRLRKKDGGS